MSISTCQKSFTASNAIRCFCCTVVMYSSHKVVIFVYLGSVYGESFSSRKHFTFSVSGSLLSRISPASSPSIFRNPGVILEVQSISSAVGLLDVGPFVVRLMGGGGVVEWKEGSRKGG
eukprot:TRINITY_DN1744_c0_g1_i4.p1 TRINITY_DN1744_c0_g1~~TRINITY_DN1744_c0_g1_i4.p1  ORF type:complete len:118 (-),score=0.21 TRINITY_DN1744_c0_g1_i4:15-368(-)